MEFLKVLAVAALVYSACGFDLDDEPILSEIHGYHFHTYFFPKNPNSLAEATLSRERILKESEGGVLQGCAPGRLHLEPVGPHTVAQFVTCCNATSHSPATSWFMQNRGNLTVLLHALTRYELADHSTRAMFIGPSMRLDLDRMREDTWPYVEDCDPYTVRDDHYDDLSELPEDYVPYH